MSPADGVVLNDVLDSLVALSVQWVLLCLMFIAHCTPVSIVGLVFLAISMWFDIWAVSQAGLLCLSSIWPLQTSGVLSDPESGYIGRANLRIS